MFILAIVFTLLGLQPVHAFSDLNAECLQALSALDADAKPENIKQLCGEAQRLKECKSVQSVEIPHFNFPDPNPKAKKILVFGLIHGDEPLSGKMALRWAQRLKEISHRNDWRIIPITNPDGLAKKTRTNGNGVDLNRNFPTEDWQTDATKYWRARSAGEKRRYPGPNAASEPETLCVMAQIQDFKPDFIVAIHTPYNVLDFDGPKLDLPSYRPIPWRKLGNFPGSLGRFMWKDHQIPVLTIELKASLVDPNHLQDMIGTFAIRTSNHLGKRSTVSFEHLKGSETVSNRTPTSDKADL